MKVRVTIKNLDARVVGIDAIANAAFTPAILFLEFDADTISAVVAHAILVADSFGLKTHVIQSIEGCSGCEI